MVVASPADRILLEPLLEKVFEKVMATPQPEPYFRLLWRDPEEFLRYQHSKGLIVAALATPADSSGDILIRKLLGEERVTAAMEGDNPIFMSSDHFSRGQLFMGLAAFDAIHAQEELRRLGSWIVNRFEEQLRVRQLQAIYSHNEQKKLSRQLKDKYGWHLRIQHDYIIIAERREGDFVWLGRGIPYRWLSVHWIENADSIRLDPAWAWERQEYIARERFQDIYIDSVFRSTELSRENGHGIYILRGVWGHREEVTGGPFCAYIFRDRQQNRIYFLNGIVNNPGGMKAMLVRQQEVIMRTFHTFQVPAPADGRDPSWKRARGAGKLTREQGSRRLVEDLTMAAASVKVAGLQNRGFRAGG